MVVYDAAIIGAGAEGLTAAAVLARAGHKTIVIERNAAAGGRCATRAFHPGFRASTFADEIAPIPSGLFWSLDLARHGALFAPSAVSSAIWPDRCQSLAGGAELCADARARAKAILERSAAGIAPPSRWAMLTPRGRRTPWPAEDWADRALADVVGERITSDDECAHAISSVVAGRAADPFLPGSALHLLAPGDGGSGMVRGGLGSLSAALEAAAREGGAAFSFGLEVSDIRQARGRVNGVVLADGSEIAAHAVLSTLDLKRTFLSLFAWAALPPALVRRVNGFRMAAGSARLLVALDCLPERLSGAEMAAAARGALHVSPDIAALTRAFAAWRAGAVPETLPLMLRFPSITDPSLAPVGSATMTVTIGCVPHRPFDSAWTHEKRERLRDGALAAIEAVLPGLGARVLASELIVPPDIEEALARTDGDLTGGELAPDQMLATRPWSGRASAPRTPLRGLYLAGPSTTAGALASGASGAAAARAVLADRKSGFLP